MQPTAPELAILKALWHQQPSSARDIHESVIANLEWSFSSTRKTLERMVGKETLEVVVQGNTKAYQARVKKVTVLASYVQDLAERVFELDGPLPVAMFSDSRLIDKDEIDDLEKLLNEQATRVG